MDFCLKQIAPSQIRAQIFLKGNPMLGKRKAGGLSKLDTARAERMVQSFAASVGDTSSRDFDALADPGRRELDAFTDDELAELIAREPGSKHGLLSSSILRNRDSWRTPARWALAISGLSLAVAISAFAVSMFR